MSDRESRLERYRKLREEFLRRQSESTSRRNLDEITVQLLELLISFGTRSDDADSYVSQFESIANANNEGTDVDKLRIFLGLLRKQAHIWYSQVEPDRTRGRESLAAVIASVENFETSKLARKRQSMKKYRKSKTDSNDNDDDANSDSSSSSSSSEYESSDSSESDADKGQKTNKRRTKRKDDTKVVEDKSSTSKVEKLWKNTPRKTALLLMSNTLKILPRSISPVGQTQIRTKKLGHFSPDCPQPRKPIGYVPLCLNCREPGHKYPDSTPAATDTKAKAGTNAVVQRIDVIEGKLAKTKDQFWPSDVKKIFKVTTRSKSSSKSDQKSSTKHRKSAKTKSSSKMTNKFTTKEDLKDDPDYDRDVVKLFAKDISVEAKEIMNAELKTAPTEKVVAFEEEDEETAKTKLSSVVIDKPTSKSKTKEYDIVTDIGSL
ncbi:hypothetical protein O6H91_02G139500 [Diphasiastrum complanatum]|uniref:Uncharacterized protein n=1 Tax=Diphasiastrum complanatum TaxID=34168 RepID=A0ACC2ELL8_DIPCM|nr:hypothetical protein O6H91_02G139500 [Diphasiastrum complanatum]